MFLYPILADPKDAVLYKLKYNAFKSIIPPPIGSNYYSKPYLNLPEHTQKKTSKLTQPFRSRSVRCTRRTLI